MDIASLDRIKIHFIVGPGRSGTTMLCLLLGRYPGCIASPELYHFIRFYGKYSNATCVTSSMIAELNKYFDEIASGRKGLLFPAADRSILTNLREGEPISYSQITKLVHLAFHGVKDPAQVNCIIDKNPFYTFHASRLNKVFPDARFFVLSRDYHAYVNSNLRSQNPAVKVRSAAYYAWTWRVFMREVNELKETFADRFLVAKYEDLCKKTELVLPGILNFFSIQSADNLKPALPEQISKAGLNIHPHLDRRLKALSAPLNADAVDHWKQQLPENVISDVERICCSTGTVFGYSGTGNVDTGTPGLRLLLSGARVFLFRLLNSPRLFLWQNVTKKQEDERKLLSRE
jgi:hypothetical protein